MGQVVRAGALDDRLRDLYYTPSLPTSLGGRRKLLRGLDNGYERKASEWLRGERAYTLHRAAPVKFLRRKTIVTGRGEQAQLDLMDVRSHRDGNDDTAFLMTAIDVFSKKAWAFPIKSKSGGVVAEALDSLLTSHPFKKIQTDKGTEFYNSRVKSILKRHRTGHFSSENETTKASVVERFNRTLRNIIHRHLTATDGDRYINSLSDMVLAYNGTVHDSIGMSPDDVTDSNQGEVWNKLYESDNGVVSRSPSLAVGDSVRISKARGAFERGYTANWSEEVFSVTGVLHDEYPIVYRIADLAGEEIAGTFYGKELQKVHLPDTFKIERVLKKRRKGKQMFVKWLGYPESMNSWVDAKDFV